MQHQFNKIVQLIILSEGVGRMGSRGFWFI